MSLTSEVVEHEYVHSIYSRLATYQNKKDSKSSSPRVWPRVQQFVDQQSKGSVILDVGCGEAKYSSLNCHVIGFDTCPEVLTSNQKQNIDLVLADAIRIPVKSETIDAILNVSVIHHLSTFQRRKQVVEECSRCLRVGGQMLIYAWAFEQPNGKFASQDILVPWNLHETPIAGRLPKVKFHLNTTKEQRIISASIPVQIADPSTSARWFSDVISKVTFLTNQIPYFSKKCSTSASSVNPTASQKKPPVLTSPRPEHLPSAAPQFLPTTSSIISGIKRWSPMLGKRLASLLVPVEEQFSEELAQIIMRESITEAMATLREVTFYRFYHVFKEGELSSLIDSINDLRIISTSFEHGNWCVVAEKIPQNYIRP